MQERRVDNLKSLGYLSKDPRKGKAACREDNLPFPRKRRSVAQAVVDPYYLSVLAPKQFLVLDRLTLGGSEYQYIRTTM